MFRDCWDYICYKIQDTILKNGQKQNRKKQENINRTTHRKAGFLLQKTAVVIAGILWLIAAARVFWNMPQTGVQENVLSAFGSASYKEVCADISAYGKYGSMELTDTAKEIILEKAAEKIGINRYTIEQTSRDNVETMQLSQNGENGSVLCRFITIHQENVEYEQYLYIGVTLKNTVDASFTYEKLIRQIMEEMQIDTEVFSTLPFTDREIISLFGNLLDNALEACEKINDKERWIKIKIKKKNLLLYIEIANALEEMPKQIQKEFVSNKKDNGLHGYGMKNIQDIVRKYDGIFRYKIYGEYLVCIISIYDIRGAEEE